MNQRWSLRGWLAAVVPVVLAVLVLAAASARHPVLAQAGPAARSGPARVEAVEVELVSDGAAIVPGRAARLGLRIRHDPHWHTYWRNPGDSGLATQLDLVLPAGFSAGAIEWPAPQRLFIPPLANYGYEDDIVLPVPLQVPGSLAGERLRFAAKASWLMCRDVCIPGEADLVLELPIQRAGVLARSSFAALFDQAERRTPRQTLAVSAFADGERLSIGLPARAAAVEFFPYREGLLRNAAEQVLYASARGARLELRLSEDGARQARAGGAALRAAAEGIVVVDGEPRELAVSIAAAALPAGAEISRVAGAPPVAPAPAPGQGRRGLELPGLAGGAPAAASPGAAAAPLAAGSALAGSLWLAALFGAIGGLILNLMPCVFPVIGLKVLGFARHGSEASAASRLAALAFAAGVVVSFWLLGGLLLGLRAAGEVAGWGFQLQSPLFVAAMALLFVAIALNFSGVYEIALSATRLGSLDHGGAGSAHPLAGSFGSGVLAVLVATPCTAPFMGSALGYTLGSSTLEAMVVFTAIGVGMAAPYLLLGWFPAWLRWLPRPGRWMETFRQVLAFPMYATAAWLAWVLGQQAGIDAVLALAIGAVLLALALWLTGRFVQQGGGARRGWAAALAVAAFALGLWTAWPEHDAVGTAALPAPSGGSTADVALGSDAIGWQPWSRSSVEEALASGRPVFVDFTAAWCVSCQVNKRLVLERDAIVAAMTERRVLRLKADWTHRDPAITAELARFGRNGVPLYLLYRPGEREPQILPELLTQGMVMDALTR